MSGGGGAQTHTHRQTTVSGGSGADTHTQSATVSGGGAQTHTDTQTTVSGESPVSQSLAGTGTVTVFALRTERNNLCACLQRAGAAGSNAPTLSPADQAEPDVA